MKKQSKKTGKKPSILNEIQEAMNASKDEKKVRVTCWVDLDVYESLNEEASRTGSKYQTLLNKYLRASVLREVSEADIKAIKAALTAWVNEREVQVHSKYPKNSV